MTRPAPLRPVPPRPMPLRRVVDAMAMPFAVSVSPAPGVSERAFADAVAGLHADLRWADDVFSLWRDDTPMARLARGEVSVEDCPPAVAEVLALAERMREATGGVFDARRPPEEGRAASTPSAPDPTGIVKAWAVERASRWLDALDSPGWLVGAAGDLLARGVGPDGEPWRAGIADPRRPADPQGAPSLDAVQLGARHRALCTSGTAQHGQHLWNPATGRREAAYAQASVLGDDMVACDAWATAVAVGGEQTALAAQRAGMEVLVIPQPGGEGLIAGAASPGWPSLGARGASALQ